MKKFLLAGVAVIALASSVSAADLGVPGVPIATAVMVPTFSWTGFYAGAHVGYGWGRSRAELVFAPANVVDGSGNVDPKGIFGGLHVGYNYQTGNLVLGLEADANLSSVGGRVTVSDPAGVPRPPNSVTSRLTWNGSARVRLGYAIDRLMPFVTGGVALGEYRVTPNYVVSGTLPESSTHVGWTLGAGMEYALAANWTARVEYRYTDYGRKRYPIPTDPNEETRINLTTHDVRLGVSYLFSTGGGPVVARY